jgi:IS5 family transposase
MSFEFNHLELPGGQMRRQVVTSPWAGALAQERYPLSIRRWQPKDAATKQETAILKRVARRRKLFAFLRLYRMRIFDEEFQGELDGMYRDTGAGLEVIPPALMAMALILQGYLGVSDGDAVELTVLDLRWQMVLDRLGDDEPAFSQGALFEFRERLIRTDMDRRLLERTTEVARQTNAFDWRKVPKTLRVAIDSSPLVGAGRVEDTINLLGHAARKIVVCAAKLLGWSPKRVARAAGIPILLESSVKKALDVEWADGNAKGSALNNLVEQLDSLETWVRVRLAEELKAPPLEDAMATLQQIRNQDLDPDPDGEGKARIRQGVAEDRRVSIEDPEMRHGRKTKSKRFNGYKRHIASDLDTNLIVACVVTPANRPEGEAMPELKADIQRTERVIAEAHMDRGYIGSPVVAEILAEGGEVICKPWVSRNGDLFTKAAFKINIRAMTITCPAGEVQTIRPGAVAAFDPEACAACDLRPQCTNATPGNGRTVNIAEDEVLQQRLRKRMSTPRGRRQLRQRVSIEHSLAHISQRQGNRARYRGVRKNQYDLRRAAIIQNLERIQSRLEEKKAA